MTCFISFDLETTGLVPNWNEATEIGAVLLRPDTLCTTTEVFQIKLRIERPERVEPGILGIKNHYDAAVWEREAVAQADGWMRFCDWVHKATGGAERAVLVGQNIAKFDQPMMEHWCAQFHLQPMVSYHPEDLLANFHLLRRRLGVKSAKANLRVIAEFFGVANPSSHTALADAQTTGACFALSEHYLDTLVDHGRLDHTTLLNEAWRRLGYPRAGTVPLKPRTP